jgi:hypothetical protein
VLNEAKHAAVAVGISQMPLPVGSPPIHTLGSARLESGQVRVPQDYRP